MKILYKLSFIATILKRIVIGLPFWNEFSLFKPIQRNRLQINSSINLIEPFNILKTVCTIQKTVYICTFCDTLYITECRKRLASTNKIYLSQYHYRKVKIAEAEDSNNEGHIWAGISCPVIGWYEWLERTGV